LVVWRAKRAAGFISISRREGALRLEPRDSDSAVYMMRLLVMLVRLMPHSPPHGATCCDRGSDRGEAYSSAVSWD